MKEQCQGTTRAGGPCPVPCSNKVTPGYCIVHDPGITKEMRAEWSGSRHTYKLKHPRIHLRTINQVIGWLEELANEFKLLAPVITAEVMEVNIQLAKVVVSALKERDTGEKSNKVPASWRETG